MENPADSGARGLAGPIAQTHQGTGARPVPIAKGEPAPGLLSAHSCHPSIALVEDDREMASMLAELLRAQGYLVDVFPDGLSWLNAATEALHSAEALGRWQVVISDVRMPRVSGLAALRMAKVRATTWFPPVIIITAFGDSETYAEAERLGVAAVFDKPFDVDLLLAKVREVAPP